MSRTLHGVYRSETHGFRFLSNSLDAARKKTWEKRRKTGIFQLRKREKNVYFF
jgi:hypothetical protein